jgi:EAL domain-containing protein (putative c-di-GMP-specific phosphodiesterase class I)
VVLDNLAALRALGVKLALDDFGTGYSSFAYLKKLRFDTIKIDREFVRDLGNDAPATAIVTAIIELAHNLDMKVVAEGVEQSAQLQVLRALGCEEVQGYLVGAAVADPYVRPAVQLAVH